MKRAQDEMSRPTGLPRQAIMTKHRRKGCSLFDQFEVDAVIHLCFLPRKAARAAVRRCAPQVDYQRVGASALIEPERTVSCQHSSNQIGGAAVCAALATRVYVSALR